MGKSIYKIDISINEPTADSLFKIKDKHIKDWKLSFDGKYLLFISESTLYKYDIINKKITEYILSYKKN